jgi:hypothetical protein
MGTHASLNASRATTRQLLVLVGTLLLLACQQTLPLAPSELATGIVIYEHADYLGASAHITQDIKDLKDFKGPMCRVLVGRLGRNDNDRGMERLRFLNSRGARLVGEVVPR